MNSIAALNGSHRRTYDKIFQHPISHNLDWKDVQSLFAKIGSIEEEHSGNFKVMRNGQALVLHAPKKKDIAEMDEIIAMRHFLQRSEQPALPEKTESHCLLVIDHHEARLFESELHGANSQQIQPHAPEDYFRHAHNSKAFARGKEKPDPNSYFKLVAEALPAIGSILIFGTGIGTSNEMDQFVTWVQSHQPAIAKRIIGTLVTDTHHLTDDQILAKARELYAASAPTTA